MGVARLVSGRRPLHLKKDLGQAKHWRKDCKFRDEAIASRKAAKEANKSKRPRNGRGYMASAGNDHGEDSSIDSSDDEDEGPEDSCSSCEDDHRDGSNRAWRWGA